MAEPEGWTEAMNELHDAMEEFKDHGGTAKEVKDEIRNVFDD